MFCHTLFHNLRRTHRKHLMLFATLLCLGCPGTEDDRSGRYIEQREGINDEVYVIDYFRFGDYSTAVLRRFRAPSVGAINSESQLQQQLSCRWTSVGNAPTDEGNLRLELPPLISSSSTMSMEGSFSGDDSLQFNFNEGNGSPPVSRRFRRLSDAPSNDCEEIRPFLIQPDFDRDDSVPNRLQISDGRVLQRPTFALVWLGVQPRTSDTGTVVWIAKSEIRDSVPLGQGNLVAGDNAIRGEFNVSVEPPSDSSMVNNGATRYALAHFVIVDDSCPEDERNPQGRCTEVNPSRFSWDVDDEPIIATALQLGVEQSPSSPSGAVGLGKAMFFVEGRLSELDPDMLAIIENNGKYRDKRDNTHFYIVDVFFDDNRNIIKLRLPEDPQFTALPPYRTINLRMTTDYLDASQILLPRLFPL